MGIAVDGCGSLHPSALELTVNLEFSQFPGMGNEINILSEFYSCLEWDVSAGSDIDKVSE